MKLIGCALLALPLLSACTGKIVTTRIDGLSVGESVDGVVYYGYKMVEKKSLRDRIRQEKTGEITHSMYEPVNSDKYCEPQVEVEMVAVADYSQPFVVDYKPAFFETRKFSVTLDKGMLSAVNSESTPGPKAAVESLQGLLTAREDLLNGIQGREKQTVPTLMLHLDQKDVPAPRIACTSKT